MISYAVGLQTGELGLALFFAVPISFGAILGFSVRCTLWVAGILVIALVCGVVCTLVTVNMAGFFCGLTLILIFALPAFVGMFLGFFLRVYSEGNALAAARLFATGGVHTDSVHRSGGRSLDGTWLRRRHRAYKV